MFLREQFLHSCTRELDVFMMERSPSNTETIKELADVYAASSSVVGVKGTIKLKGMVGRMNPILATGKSSLHTGRDSGFKKLNLPSPENL